MRMQQFFGPGGGSACVVIDEGYDATARRCGANVPRIRKSRRRFDEIGEIEQPFIAPSETRGATLVWRIIDYDSLERVRRNVLLHQRFDRLRQQIVPVV